MEKPTVIVICGPTASGKTALSIELAKKIDFKPITLGQRILRTETAGLATLAMLMYNLEG